MLKLVLFFHCVGPRDQIQVIRFGSKFLYTLSHLSRHTNFLIEKLRLKHKRPSNKEMSTVSYWNCCFGVTQMEYLEEVFFCAEERFPRGADVENEFSCKLVIVRDDDVKKDQ